MKNIKNTLELKLLELEKKEPVIVSLIKKGRAGLVGGAVLSCITGEKCQDYDVVLFYKKDMDYYHNLGESVEGYQNRVEYKGFDIFLQDGDRPENYPWGCDIDITSFCYSGQNLFAFSTALESIEAGIFRYVNHTWDKEERVKKYQDKGYTFIDDTLLVWESSKKNSLPCGGG